MTHFVDKETSTKHQKLEYLVTLALFDHINETGIYDLTVFPNFQIIISFWLGRHTFMADFIEAGGTLTLLEIISFKQTKEINKTEAVKCLYNLGNAGRKYKELICECYGK